MVALLWFTCVCAQELRIVQLSSPATPEHLDALTTAERNIRALASHVARPKISPHVVHHTGAKSVLEPHPLGLLEAETHGRVRAAFGSVWRAAAGAEH